MTGDNLDADRVNIDASWVGAYAEKPIRDLVNHFKDELKSDEKLKFESYAGEIANEAIADFKSSKSLETPQLDALRSLAKDVITVNPDNRIKMADAKTRIDREVWDDVVSTLSSEITERVIAGPGSDRKKKELIEGMGAGINIGIELSLNNLSLNNQQIERVASQYLKKDGSGVWEADQLAFVFEGFFVERITKTNAGVGAINALDVIARITNRNPKDVIQDHLGIINKLRSEYPGLNADNYILGSSKSGVKTKNFDGPLSDHGYLWSPITGSYVYFGSDE